MKAFSRRSFLTGLCAAGAGAWLHDSDHIAARSIRSSIADHADPGRTARKPNWRDWNPGGVTVAWLGHATVLIDFQGIRILTDPVLFDWVGLDLEVATFGEKRLIAPALRLGELPPVDVVLISHAHMDHLDFPTMQALPKGAHVITAPNTEDLVREAGHRKVSELRWGESRVCETEAGGLEVKAFEVNHWGARWKNDTHRGYNGYLLRRNGVSLVFGGDTALCDTFSGVRQARPLAAIMPVGSYGRSSRSHCTPEEAVRMVNDCRAEFILPVHHSTFPLGKEPLTEPLARTEAAIAQERIGLREPGDTWTAQG